MVLLCVRSQVVQGSTLDVPYYDAGVIAVAAEKYFGSTTGIYASHLQTFFVMPFADCGFPAQHTVACLRAKLDGLLELQVTENCAFMCFWLLPTNFVTI